ncbi:hypothetical protein ABL78_3082 [Leptomonas seymouri]|uniref:BSD domain-containing protein n=1 Tax=Leptomonas seymouri TaxID=5684 RepID=A0A0N1ILJ7_LEPSE|nr:hypothetical protein ABL78_3082 [Leptomonas seymouri]|eukprot:KPI87855.1 hypothetical protein ABL78_3082 [Leptomonas seymouri]
MSSAEFVRNPNVNTAVYRWDAAGIDGLTRQNKLTSLPFWTPNAATRHHQFKLVLLRGLVPSADAANDAFGLIVELIPPPSFAVEGGADSGVASSPSMSFPGGCAVTCEVLPLDALETGLSAHTEAEQQQQQQRDAHDKGLCCTKTAVVDASNRQVSFTDMIPADILTNTRYVSGTQKSLTLQVTIETGINVPLHQVATTAYSFFTSFSSSMSQLLGTTTHLVHEGRENLASILHQASTVPSASQPPTAADAGTGGGALPSSSRSADADGVSAVPPPWEQPPEEWSSRPDAWRSLLCVRLAGLAGTYRHGVEKTLSSDEAALLSEVGLSESDLWSQYTLFDFSRDVQESLLTADVVRAQRYTLVPARLKEETFWANYFWKTHCMAQCVTERQVSAVIAALCTPSGAVDAGAPAAVEELLRVIVDSTELDAVMNDFIGRDEAGEPWCAVVAEKARHCAAVLQASSSQRSDLSLRTKQQLTKALSALQATLSKHEETLSTHEATLSTSTSTPAVEPATPPSSPIAPGDAVADGAAELPVVDLTQTAATQGAATSSLPVLDATPMKAMPDPAAAVEERDCTQDAVSPEAVAPSLSPLPPTAPAPTPSEAALGTQRIEFEKMPWEEEDG